jgi:flagellar biosynthesis protein FlhA
MMIVPLPPFLLDLFIAFNITLAIVVILTVMYTIKAIEFSSYPTLLLVATVFRLAINVSTTRMILLGRGEEISIIKAFGTFVIGGNFVVGVVIFLILIMIQLMVIIRGTTRVSEVAARFTLDAMPGKQMAIDADLNAGLITEKEAIERREEIKREADFYGAMDGACKFVAGDVRAGLIITGINIVGGLIIGIVMLKMDPLEAARSYTLLTVGDGLVSQIPALLISVATGLIVSRAASESNLGEDLVRELSANPKVLGITSGTLAALGIFTPLPALPLLALAGGTGFLAYSISRTGKIIEEEEAEKKRREEVEEAKKPESVVSLLQVDPMELEIGYALIPLVDPEQGGDLLDRVTLIRRQAALDLGIIVPPIRIRDNMQLKPNVYVIKIKGVEVARGEVRPDRYLAMNPGTATEEIKGEKTTEPAFGLPAIWIREADRERAEVAGYTVVDAPSIVATHLTEVIKKNAPEILGRQEVQTLLDNLKESYPAIVEEVSGVLSIGEIQKVLHNLLREEVSIRDLLTILETLADYAPQTKDIDILTERVRAGLSRQICNQYVGEDGVLRVITLDPSVEELITSSLQQTPEGEQVVLDPGTLQKLLMVLKENANKVSQAGYQPVLLTSPQIRRHIKQISRRTIPNLVVLSYNEIIQDIQVTSLGTIKIQGSSPPPKKGE